MPMVDTSSLIDKTESINCNMTAFSGVALACSLLKVIC